jgi:tryptophanyl-tRNA synthetase
MSKSIPESSINLGDSDEVLAQKILHGDSRNEHVICQMMILASDWDAAKKAAVKEAFRSRSDQWTSFKEEYLELFLSIKRIWERSADAAVSASNAYQSIYRR